MRVTSTLCRLVLALTVALSVAACTPKPHRYCFSNLIEEDGGYFYERDGGYFYERDGGYFYERDGGYFYERDGKSFALVCRGGVRHED